MRLMRLLDVIYPFISLFIIGLCIHGL